MRLRVVGHVWTETRMTVHIEKPEAARPHQMTSHDAHDLIPEGSTAQIQLDGQTYVLRITRAGKLILTK
jgi:hemin uptake protein HemP